jgi:LPS export ABC transporter protein LptC
MRKSLWIKMAVAAAVVLAAAAWFVFFSPTVPDGKNPAPLKILPEEVDLQAKDVLYTEVGRGDVKYEIRAKTVTYQKKDNVAEFEDVNVKLIMPKGKIYTITADRGTYNTEKKDISMAGSVVVRSDEGERITTDRLFYTDAEKRIHTASPVTMVNKNIEVKGVGLTFLLDKKQLALLSQVKATVTSRPRAGKTETNPFQKKKRGKS